jgi:hypothetical protein
MKKCAFCESEAVEKGGEHIFDDWLNRALPKSRYNARKRLTLESPSIAYAANSLNEKLSVVCEPCNSGWMSAVTQKTKQHFSGAILRAEPFSLRVRDAALLAAFTFMKAVVTNHSMDDDPFFTRAARERFRASLVIPPLVKIWLGAYQGAARFSTKNTLGIISATGPGSLYGMEFCSYTYVVGNLALQLLAPRWKYIRDRGRPLISISPHIFWQQSATQFWPNAGSVVSWPREKYFGDDMIEAFINRFEVTINVPI